MIKTILTVGAIGAAVAATVTAIMVTSSVPTPAAAVPARPVAVPVTTVLPSVLNMYPTRSDTVLTDAGFRHVTTRACTDLPYYLWKIRSVFTEDRNGMPTALVAGHRYAPDADIIIRCSVLGVPVQADQEPATPGGGSAAGGSVALPGLSHHAGHVHDHHVRISYHR